MRVDLTPYSLLAFIIVVAAACVAAGLAELARRWAASLLRAGPRVAGPCLAVTATAALNLVVPRTCGPRGAGVVNRPLLSAVTGDACAGEAWAQLVLVPVAVVVSTAVVLLASRRARPEGGGGPPPATVH